MKKTRINIWAYDHHAKFNIEHVEDTAESVEKAILDKLPLPNHMTDQMNRTITPMDYDVLQSLESLPGNALKYGLVALSSGRQLTFLRFINKTSVTSLANIEFAAARQAHSVSLCQGHKGTRTTATSLRSHVIFAPLEI